MRRLGCAVTYDVAKVFGGRSSIEYETMFTPQLFPNKSSSTSVLQMTVGVIVSLVVWLVGLNTAEPIRTVHEVVTVTASIPPVSISADVNPNSSTAAVESSQARTLETAESGTFDSSRNAYRFFGRSLRGIALLRSSDSLERHVTNIRIQV